MEILYPKLAYFPDAISNPKKALKAVTDPDVPWSDFNKMSNNNDGSITYTKRGRTKTIYYSEYNYKRYPKVVLEGYEEILNAIRNASIEYAKEYNLTDRKELNDLVISTYDLATIQHLDLPMHIDVLEDREEYSILIYYNDNYESGELHFPEQQIKFKPKAGSIVIFPSGQEFPHEALAASNNKYFTLHYWFGGPGPSYKKKEK